MKITIETQYRTTSVAVPNDDVTIVEVMELIRAALLAQGFHPYNVSEAIGDDDC